MVRASTVRQRHPMTRRSQSSRSAPKARAALAAKLRTRLPELESEILNRVGAIGNSTEIADPEYRDGLRRAILAGAEHGIAVVELGERRVGPVPVALLGQARLAARHGVSLGTMHRRCIAGKHLFAEALFDEARRQPGLGDDEIERLRSSQAAVFDRMLAQLEDEYEREAQLRPGSSHDRLAERVKQLLAGELVDVSDLPYDFGDDHHIGVVANGEATGAIRRLAKDLDARPLIVRPGGPTVWAWLGTRQPVCRHRFGRTIASCWPSALPVGVGEPDHGLIGWRLTHRQALAVAPTAHRQPGGIARFAENAILAAIERDDLLATSLRKLYVEPLEDERNRGLEPLRTLRAYLEAGRNGQSAAAALNVTRQTVSNRLKKIEELLGRSLTGDTADIEIALRLADASTYEDGQGWPRASA